MIVSFIHAGRKLPRRSWCKLSWCVARNFILLSRRNHSYQGRENAVGIQMLSELLHKQVFRDAVKPEIDRGKLEVVEAHLQKHGLSQANTSFLKDVDLRLPELRGESIEDHFYLIAQEQLKDYRCLIEEIVCAPPPLRPKEWQFQRGWTKYLKDGSAQRVEYPDNRGLVFDVECLMGEGNFPTMATAVSANHWYSWVSDHVLRDRFRWTKEPQLKDLIPLETRDGSVSPSGKAWLPRLIIGHNVGFDRSFVKEQYLIQGTQLRFLDTMSMHVAVCGQTSFQRLLHKASGKGSHRKEVMEHAQRKKLFNMAASEEWKKISSMNNLRDVHQLHCGGEPLEKAIRDVFVEGTMENVRAQFQDLMQYCSSDVVATREVFLKLWPQFCDRFPHPVTLSGMLEMGTAYLPLNSAWPRYIQHAQNTYDESERELKKLLMSLADEACLLLENDEYKTDPWLWNLDWSTSEYRLKKSSSPGSNVKDPFENGQFVHNSYTQGLAFEKGEQGIEDYKSTIRNVLSTSSRVPKNPVFMSGYPAWYRDLCPRPNDPEFYPGPSNISTQCRVAPKLMRLTWEDFPVHYDDNHGWGYLVPHQENVSVVEKELQDQDGSIQEQHAFPLKSYMSFLRHSKRDSYGHLSPGDLQDRLNSADFEQHSMEPEEKMLHWETAREKKTKKVPDHVGVGPFDVGIPGVRFFKIPHKDGSHNKVGNPLARDYLLRAEDGTLKAMTGSHANRALILGRLCSYWKNNHKRISGQMHLWLKKSELDRTITRNNEYEGEGLYGAIVPRIVTAGTITRRAVEPTWLTASNAYRDRIGSELKAMVQAPPGYHFVGADVDSQELWIAAIFGDAFFMKEHGCTALGWMTLQGSKADRTDLHSKTAEIADISRDHAKVLNYGRIYGAGQTFAERLLMQFNPQLNAQDVKRKALSMYKQTKGQRNSERQWYGGTESYMFNALEAVANSEKPRTPVLGCQISKALEPQFVLDDFLTSRVNWVVQSSAVDYLHLMLVCMRWLLSSYNIRGRFCVSIHDEVRYLVCSSDRYRAALALQITNLLTRSMFSHRLGMGDLPQSVAFFSAIDIDKCLRKEVHLDCITPSNPHGLQQGYDMPPGEALDIHQIIEKTGKHLKRTSSRQPS